MVDAEKIFIKQLKKLDLLLQNGKSPEGMFFVKDKNHISIPLIRIALEQAENFQADAVFFRIFADEEKRSPVPQIYIYRNTSLTLDEAKYAGIHCRLWNAGLVPLAFIFTATSIRVLNCRRAPDIDRSTNKPLFSPFSLLESLILTEQAFITRDITTGTFWEDPKFKSYFTLEKTAYHQLLIYLKDFRKEILKQETLSKSVTNRLLVISILVKYLCDRKDADGNGVFKKGFFSQFSKNGYDDFASLFLEHGSCVKLFENLSKHFNGGIFELTEDDKRELSNADLRPIADFLRGDQEPSGQCIFWPLYSFEDLPIELISNIYEEFLAKKQDDKPSQKKTDDKGVVYTPPMLVEFLLDQCLPIKPEILQWKILDPACGSGVFLVGAFKRLIYCWRMVNNWNLPSLKDLKSLLKNNIFGFDEKPESVLITAFSLCVALCDELEPLSIWNELKFDDLRQRNLLARDFFEIVKSGEFNDHYDLIIGNPPFESSLTTTAAKDIEKCESMNRPELPDQQLALLFYEQSFKLCHESATVCLIQPAGPLLYNGNGISFRTYLFGKFHTECIFDFTSLDEILFTKVQVAAAAIMGYNHPPSSDKILHIIFHRTRASKEKLLFELDPYDFHWVDRKLISDNKFVWKANLLGGGRLQTLLKRFSDFPTLGEYLEEQRIKRKWQFSEGYIIGCGKKLNDASNIQELIRLSPDARKKKFELKRLPKTAEWISGALDVPSSALNREGIDWNHIKSCKATFFEETRNSVKEIFSPPHVLIREIVDKSSIPAIFSNKYLVFSNQMIGISAPKKDAKKLKALADQLNDSGLYGVLAAMVSSRMLVNRATSLLQRDIFALPYSEDMEKVDFNFWENILIEDIEKYLIEFRNKGETASVLDGVDDSDLFNFGETFCHILNPVYEKFFPLKPIKLRSFICFPFCYGDAPDIDPSDTNKAGLLLEKLMLHKHGNRLFVNRILRLYEENVILIIKPNQKRYWLRSIALRDADETLVDLLDQGY